MLVTAPQIGRLLCRPHIWAWRQVKAGAFGPVVRRRGRALWVELERVESYTGASFTAEQLGRRFTSLICVRTRPTSTGI